jgi:7-carboxy-7-deazaguanine synthase
VIYPVTAVFKSLQGEGHFVGYPAVFVRLAGCSVRDCSIRAECDEAPWKATERAEHDELAQRVFLMAPGGIAVITGGEPTDHDLVPLVAKLRDLGMRVHLETSGVRSSEGLPIDWITVSPKRTDYVQRTGHTLKVVVRPGDDWSAVNALDEGTAFLHRYLQPMTSVDGTTNLGQVTAMLLDQSRNLAGRWALSTQAHKAWGLK